MRAAVYDRYGDPEVLSVRDVHRPQPGPRQVQVRVRATAVNPVDAKIRSGAMKLMSGRRFPKRTGGEFSGEITMLGSGVSDLAPGTQVWGFLGEVSGKAGSAAQYLVADASSIGPAPTTIDPVAAAALPTGGVTALLALRDTLKVTPGHRLLVVGASGGVGSAAIQLGVAFGAEVTAVSSPANHDLCQHLGATKVFDYADPAAVSGRFDAILDCHGTALATYRRLVRRGGRMLSTDPSGMKYAVLSTVLPGPRVRMIMAKSRRADLVALAEFVDSGRLQPVIDDVYALDDIAKAHQLAETGHARGKRLVTID
ncbi:NAD(P)-dependent alcohol dehydrogenase [Nocardia aurantiaca]|nr:NAD(P)-dependent alcohol dehydrogenase [Nocardia aurantiaca]